MVRLLPLLSLLACVHEVEPRIDPTVPTATPPVSSAPWERPSNDQLVINPARTVPEPIAAIPTFRQPLASTPILQSHDGELLFNVDTDNGTVVRVDRTDGATTTAIVGTEPTRLARAASTLYVTLRGDRRITKLDSDLQVLASQHVGAEPYGIVARTDGSRVYVTVSQQREVLELDGDTLEILARIPVPNEPRYLAITPDGMGLYVGSTRGEARVTKIDLVDFSAVPIDLPTAFRDFDSAAPLTVRLTGDFSLATLPSGITQLAIPALYVDVNTPIPDLSSVEDIEEQVPVPPNGGDGGEGVEGGYGSGGEGVERLNPAIVTVQVGNESAVEQPIFVSSPITDGFLQGNGLISQSVRSYITGVAHTPDGYLAASLEANSAVVFVRTDAAAMSLDPFGNSPEFLGFRTPVVASMRGGPGAVATVWTGFNEAYALAPFAFGVTRLDVPAVRSTAEQNIAASFNRPQAPAAYLGLTAFGTSPLSAEQELGRQLFYSAANPSMGAGGVSCSTCHVDGRNDGLTWAFEGGPRQTPSLAGVVSASAPVTWTSNVASVAMEADLTTRGRMGGQGLTPSELAAVEAFVDFTRLPDAPDVADPEAVARGAELFQSSGCGGCHAGSAFSNNQSYAFRGTTLNTPRLEGIAATAPYLFDGSASSLTEVLLKARSANAMGSTAHLSDAELGDLEAYLRTL